MPATRTALLASFLDSLANGSAADAIADAYEASYPSHFSPEGDRYTDSAIVRITEDN
jgi:hypothetical protein